MIQVTIGKNAGAPRTVVATPDQTPRKILEENSVEYARATVTLDGSTLRAGEMDKTFSELGITEKCYLFAVTKVENAQ
jgi:hypothetical protein